MPEPPARPQVTLLRGKTVTNPDDLAELAQLMLDAADHWAQLQDFEMAVQCHQAAALYFQAAKGPV